MVRLHAGSELLVYALFPVKHNAIVLVFKSQGVVHFPLGRNSDWQNKRSTFAFKIIYVPGLEYGGFCIVKLLRNFRHIIFRAAVIQDQVIGIFPGLRKLKRIGVLWFQIGIALHPAVWIEIENKRVKFIIVWPVYAAAVI